MLLWERWVFRKGYKNRRHSGISLLFYSLCGLERPYIFAHSLVLLAVLSTY